ncbi:hypothetical protein GGQ59_002949, partial [Parvularcula dongshanensis]|nr:hypothetical protein [Parvularcula dongshanensis]
MEATPAGTVTAEANLRAAEHQAKAVAHLYRPTVIASASVIAYEESLSPARRRVAIDHVRGVLGVSERRACRVVRQHR